MNMFTRLLAPVLGALLLAGCANQKDKAPMMGDAEVCIMSGEPVGADSPTSEFMGHTVKFCCDNCKAKFDGMDDAAKVAKLSKALTGAAAHKDAMMDAAQVCVMSGEPVDADSPTSEFMGHTVKFCCDNCKAKWDKLDDAAKQAKLAKQ